MYNYVTGNDTLYHSKLNVDNYGDECFQIFFYFDQVMSFRYMNTSKIVVYVQKVCDSNL